jgi:hypothetical protein
MADEGLSINGPESLAGSLLLVVLALGLVGYGAYDYVNQTNAVRDAVEVDATIVETGIQSESPPGSTDVNHWPTVEYTYQYRGERYTGERISPGPTYETYETEAAAREAASAYEPNATVTAYVDPSSPSDAFLENDVSNTPIGLAALGGLGLLFGAASAIKNSRQPD